MDKYNRIQLAVLIIGALLIGIGCYFSFNAQTVDAKKEYALFIGLGALVSLSSSCLGLVFNKLRDKDTAKKVADTLNQLADKLE